MYRPAWGPGGGSRGSPASEHNKTNQTSKQIKQKTSWTCKQMEQETYGTSTVHRWIRKQRKTISKWRESANEINKQLNSVNKLNKVNNWDK